MKVNSILPVFFKHFSIYSFAAILEKLSIFLLLPLYTNYLTKSEYAIVAVAFALSALILNLCDPGFSNGFMRFFEQSVNDKTSNLQYNSREYFSTYIFSLLIWTLLITIIVFAFKNQLFSLLCEQPKHYNFSIVILIFYIFFHTAAFSFLTYLRISGKSAKYALASLALTLGRIGLVVLLFYMSNNKINAIFLSFLIPNIFLFIFFLFSLRHLIQIKINIQLLKKFIQFGLPLMFTSLSFYILDISDRLIIKYFFSSGDYLALYDAQYKIASVLLMAITPLSILWPHIIYSYPTDIIQKKINDIFQIYVSILIILLLLLSFYSKNLILLFANREYIGSYLLIPLIGTGYIFFGIYNFFNISMHLENKTPIILAITVSAAVINIILNFIFIPLWNIQAAAATTSVSYAFMVLYSYYYSRKNNKINVDLFYFIKHISLAIIIIIFFYFVESSYSGNWIIILKIIILLLYIASFYRRIKIYG